MRECYKDPRQNECYRKIANDFLDHFRLGETLAILGANEPREEFFERCHTVAHYLGQEAYKRTRSVKTVLSQGSFVCLSGIFHGAMEGYFIENKVDLLSKNDFLISQKIKTLCGSQEDYQIPNDFGNCTHGLGHALMYLTENDLPRALEFCDSLDTLGEKWACHTGALMENADSLQSNIHPSAYIKRDDPYYPCSIIHPRYQRACYTYALPHRFQNDFRTSVQVCSNVPASYQEQCFYFLGFDRILHTKGEYEIKEECARIPSQIFRRKCIEGAAHHLLTRFGPDSSSPQKFCSFVEEEDKSACYARLGISLREDIGDEKKLLDLCASISEKQYIEVCLGKKNN